MTGDTQKRRGQIIWVAPWFWECHQDIIWYNLPYDGSSTNYLLHWLKMIWFDSKSHILMFVRQNWKWWWKTFNETSDTKNSPIVLDNLNLKVALIVSVMWKGITNVQVLNCFCFIINFSNTTSSDVAWCTSLFRFKERSESDTSPFSSTTW